MKKIITLCLSIFIANIGFSQSDPTVAAPAPTKLPANVISLFSGAYSNVPVDTWRTPWSVATLTNVVIGTDSIKKYTGLDFVGIETIANQINVSTMDSFEFDLWTPNSTSFITKLVDFGANGVFGGGDDKEHPITITPTLSGWNHVSLALSSFTGLTTKNNIAQIIFASSPAGSSTVFIDNVLFSKNATAPANEPTVSAPAPTKLAANVISLFSGAYPNVTVDTWRTSWSAATLTNLIIGTDSIKKYSGLDFVGVETVANQINASAMDSFEFDLWTPNSTTFRVKLVDFGANGVFGGGDDKEHEIAVTPTLSGWNHRSLALSSFTGLTTKSNIAQIIFSSLPAGTSTVFIDNVLFSKNAAAPANEPTVSAPTPTKLATDVISLFSGAYTNVPVDTWRTPWSVATLTDVKIGTDSIKKYTGLDFVGVETIANQINASTMDSFEFDIWTPNSTTFKIKLVDFGANGTFGGGDDKEHELNVTPTIGGWKHISLALSSFTGLTTKNNIAQIIFASSPAGSSTVFIDNVLFSKKPAAPVDEPTVSAPAPTKLATDVISLFSGAYTNVPVDTWRTPWSVATLTNVVIGADSIKKYTGLDFVGVETIANQINVSTMDSFEFDIWTPNSTSFITKLVDFGANGVFGGGDDKEHPITITPTLRGWNHVSLALSSFTGLTTKNNIAQIIFASSPAGSSTVFIDNVLFSKKPAAPANEPTVSAKAPTKLATDVISLFSGAYTNITVDTWRTSWSAATLTNLVIGTDSIKKYSGLDFVGVETVANQIDITGMDSFEFDLWTPNSTAFRFKLVDFGADGKPAGGDDKEHELSVTPTLSGWNHISMPISSFTGLTTKKNIAQIIFASSPAGSSTVFIDNVLFSKKPAAPVDEPTVSAKAPTKLATDVISLFSGAYTNVPVDTWRTPWSVATLTNVVIGTDSIKKYTGLDFVGIETIANQINISTMDSFEFDMWTPNSTNFRFKLVDFGANGTFGGGDDKEHELTVTPVLKGWNHISVPISNFAGLTTKNNIAQIIFASSPAGSSTVFIDNVLFSKGAASIPEPTVGAKTPTRLAKDVISLFSNAYTNVTVDTWRTSWSEATLTDVKIGTDDVKKYTALNFAGVETIANQINISAMDTFEFDLWTPNSTNFRFKLVDFGANGAFGGGDDKEHELNVTPILNGWNRISVPISSFTGLTTKSNIAQLVFSSTPAGSSIAYIDNVLFSKKETIGVKTVNQAKVGVYPNPATNQLNITSNRNMQEVVVYDAVGKRVLSVAPNSSIASINIAELPNGFYTIKASINGVDSFSKFIKE